MKVLIIEDDPDTSEALGYIASEQGCKVYYGNGGITLSRVKSISPGLLILDDWVNNYQGTQLCTLIKSNTATCQIPVLLISARPNLSEIASTCHCDAYLSKPFDLAELQGILSSLTHGAPDLE